MKYLLALTLCYFVNFSFAQSVSPAEYCENFQVSVLADLLKYCCDLDCQLPGGYHYQAPQVTLTALPETAVLSPQLVQNRYGKCRSLPGTCLGNRQNVLTFQDRRYCLELDVSRPLKAQFR